MTCRVCHAELAERDQTCAGCGAPKYVVEPFLEVIAGAADGTSVNLPRGEIVIGSSRRANLVLDERDIDGLHARIIRDAAGCWIEPAGSAAVILDGKQLSNRTRLVHGSVITLAAVGLVCYLPETT